MPGAVSGANWREQYPLVIQQKSRGHATKQPAWLSSCDDTSYVKKPDVFIVSLRNEILMRRPELYPGKVVVLLISVASMLFLRGSF